MEWTLPIEKFEAKVGGMIMIDEMIILSDNVTARWCFAEEDVELWWKEGWEKSKGSVRISGSYGHRSLI